MGEKWPRRYLLSVVVVVLFGLGLAGAWVRHRPIGELAEAGGSPAIASSENSISVKEDAGAKDWDAFLESLREVSTKELIVLAGIDPKGESATSIRYAEWGARDPVAALAAAGDEEHLVEQIFWAAAETQPEIAVELLKNYTKTPFEPPFNDLDRFISNFFELSDI